SPAVGKGAMLYDMMHPEDRERSRGIMARALKGELPEYVDEFRVPTRTGEWKWLQARGRVVEHDAEGRALRVSGTIADIDSRRRERQRSLLAAPSAVGFEERHLRCLDGSDIIVEAAAVSFLERDHLAVQAVFRDVTEERRARQALAEREQRFRDVVHASGEYVWETDAQWRYTYLSERVEAVLGYARNDLLGRTPHAFMPLGEAHL